ncbi:MAG: response regulator [Candidatus Muirbacterium halophilum]|nr:response regulator [Candidatus Muirbacterium halophilum]MCK9475125.1 response regulator [Candidatus Muirbacterium halophilum]
MTKKNIKKRKILILDDEKDVTDFIEILLKMEDFDVKALNTSADLMKELLENDYDLLIIDIMMPQFNGIQMTRLVKNDKKLKKMPIIVVTALNDKKNRFVAEHSGADAFFVKPFSSDELVKEVKRLTGL